jgi:hypothetical protein
MIPAQAGSAQYSVILRMAILFGGIWIALDQNYKLTSGRGG